MNNENKSLLLQDLCARLPYGVKILHETWNFEWDQEMTLLERVIGIDEKFVYVKVIDTNNGEEYRDDRICIDTFDDKMFLRPMSSMTEEEKEELKEISRNYLDEWENAKTPIERLKLDAKISYKRAVFYNSHHLDWNGLIELGLAIEAPKEMYN